MTRNWGELLASAISAGIITSAGVIVALIAADAKLTTTTWILAVAFGLGSAAKDYRAQMKLPPVETGGGAAGPSQLPK